MRPFLGIACLFAAMSIIAGAMYWRHTAPEREALKVHLIATREAVAFCRNQEIVAVLRTRYNLVATCDEDSTGKIIARKGKDLEGLDGLWPASEIAARSFIGTRQFLESVLPSPMVAYTKSSNVMALIRAGIVRTEANDSLTLLVAPFIKAMEEGKTWRSIGIEGPGAIKPRATDVKLTASGQGLMNLFAAVYNNGDPVSEETLGRIGAKVRPHIQRMGGLPLTSAELLRQCAMTGCFELNIGFENSYVRLARESPENENAMNRELRVMYLEPAVWGFHTMIGLTDKARKYVDIITKDQEIQAIAWRDHGFRTGTRGLTVDSSAVPVKGLRPNIGASVGMPTPQVNAGLVSLVTD